MNRQDIFHSAIIVIFATAVTVVVFSLAYYFWVQPLNFE